MANVDGAIPMLGGLSMRFSRPTDENFLLELFMASRPWISWVDKEPEYIRFLYEEQVRLTRLGNGAHYPEHMDFIIEKTGQAVAHVIVDLGYHDWRITQFEIHPQVQSKELGCDIIRSLQGAAERACVPLTVSAMAQSGAPAFYAQLGFMKAGEQPPMIHMAWLPPVLQQKLATAQGR